jgi:signal transduction histidine kinase
LRGQLQLEGAKTAVFEQDSSLRYRWQYDAHAPFNPVGRTDEEVFTAEDAALLTALKRRVVETGRSASHELTVTIGGERRIYRMSLEATNEHTGKTTGIIGSATDITEEKRVQQQLSDALAIRERVMGVLGHDLRNPLGVVKIAASTLQREDLSEAGRGRLKFIRNATERMEEMVGTLIDVMRVRTRGGLSVTRVPTDLGALATEVVAECGATHPDRVPQLDLRGRLEGSWDPARFTEAITNLVVNALEHGDPRRPVQLSVDGSGESVVVKVKNEGPPIPSEVRPVLFDAFSRGQTSPHGLGLGLFIVKEIAVAHGGTVDVESSAETGTVFTLVLPRAA